MSSPIDYTSKDFEGFKFSMLDYAARVFPEWTGRTEGDFGVAMVELFAYMGDILSYYGDRVAAESYIGTATQRRSVMNIAALLGYNPSDAVAATGTVTFVSDTANTDPTVIPAGTKVLTDFISKFDSPVFFETAAPVTVPAAGGTATATIVEGETQGSRSVTINQSTPYEEVVYVEELGQAEGTIDEVILIPQKPVIEGSVRFFVSSLNSNNAIIYNEWQAFNSLIDASSEDSAFIVYSDENGNTYVGTGDGINGRIPPSGSQLFISYRVGGGAKGNLPANTIIDIAEPFPGISVQGSSATTGGADPETTEQIRQNAPMVFRTQNRAVTLQDYGDLALGVTAVSKAAAVANSYSSITVFILGPNGTTATEGLRDAVRIYLDKRKMAGTTITVTNASLVPVNVGSDTAPVTVGVLPTYRRAVVRAEAVKALQSFLDPTAVQFGQRLPLSDIYKVLAAVPGVQYAIVPLLARNDATQSGTNDITFKAWEIPSAGNLVINTTGGIG